MYSRLKKAAGKYRQQNWILVSAPSECRDIHEMWRELKEKRTDPDLLRWKQEKEKQKVEELLLNWCAKHFGQTNNTPLSTMDWRNRFDPRSEHNIIDEVLEGTAHIEDEDRTAINELIHAAQRPEGWKTVQSKLDFEHFSHFCKK